MKKYFFLILVVLAISIGLFSCKKEDPPNPQDLSADMPGKFIMDMEIDKNHVFYYATYEVDTSAMSSSTSCSIPLKFYLSRRNSEADPFELLDKDLKDVSMGDELFFDRHNSLWIRNSKEIILRQGQTNRKIIELSGQNGLFEFITADNDNNIWAGGLQTGLYKIDNQLKVTNYNPENSILPTTSMTNIHIDKNSTIWIALWDNQGILRIAKNNWTIYNSSNSNITSQNIWCLVTDKNGTLWIGSGWDDKNESLLNFNGIDWRITSPENDKNEIVTGTVRGLYSDNRKIYVLSVEQNLGGRYTYQLLTFDGSNWGKIDGIPEDDRIADVKVDTYRNVIWIRALNNGIFKKAM